MPRRKFSKTRKKGDRYLADRSSAIEFRPEKHAAPRSAATRQRPYRDTSDTAAIFVTFGRRPAVSGQSPIRTIPAVVAATPHPNAGCAARSAADRRAASTDTGGDSHGRPHYASTPADNGRVRHCRNGMSAGTAPGRGVDPTQPSITRRDTVRFGRGQDQSGSDSGPNTTKGPIRIWIEPSFWWAKGDLNPHVLTDTGT